jgi:hypothetical protein
MQPLQGWDYFLGGVPRVGPPPSSPPAAQPWSQFHNPSRIGPRASNCEQLASFRRSCVRAFTRPTTRAFNPKGIVALSPGLRGTSYPGIKAPVPCNPERVAPSRFVHFSTALNSILLRISLLLATLLTFPLSSPAQLAVLPNENPQQFFGPGLRTLPVLLRNNSNRDVTTKLRFRLFQTSSATAIPLGEKPWKQYQFLPGQTVVESATVDFPAVKAETRFLVKWLAGTNEVLGTTEVLVYPTNLLRELGTLAGEEPLGVFDPQNALKPLLKSAGVEFSDLADAGTEAYQGKLVLAGPFQNRSEMRNGLATQLQALARKGVGVVWIQPPPQKDAQHRERLKPSFYLVPEGKGAVVIVQPALVQNLPRDPQAQLNLVEFARLALHPEPLSLPYLSPEQ